MRALFTTQPAVGHGTRLPFIASPEEVFQF
jgi:hypothetical protein